MANQLKVNPATSGSNNSTWIERVGAVLHDKDGNDITSSNPLPVQPIDGPLTHNDMEGKGFVTVGTTAVELTFSGTTEGITISSAVTNTGILYVGKSDVASDGSNAIAFLDVGES